MTTNKLTSEAIKRFAIETCNVDKLGIANIERFKNAPPDMHPLSIMPSAKSVIVFVRRVLRGCYRGIDQGTHWPSYTVFGYAGLNRLIVSAGYKIAKFVESHGYEGVPLLPTTSSREWGPRGPSQGNGKPKREVTIHHRLAATAAGVGAIGWSKVLLTKEFGARQRIGVVLTEAELEPDPLVTEKLCDRCKRCVAECPAHAISKDKSVSTTIDGQTFEWNDLDLGKCKLTHFGLNRTTAPHFCKRYPSMYIPVGEQGPTWKEAHDLGFTVMKDIPALEALRRLDGYIAVCGARGCVMGCMKHLEQRGKLENKFQTKPVFNNAKPWRIEEKPTQVDHHGFIYDPDSDEELNTEQKDAPTWY
jgi:ferredoxin